MEDRPEGIYFRPKVSWLFCLLNYRDIFSSVTEDHIFLQGDLQRANSRVRALDKLPRPRS